MVTIAARISSKVLLSEASKARAAPRKRDCMLGGNCSSSCTARIALTASLSEVSGARLNDKVAAGNWSLWLIASKVERCSTLARVDRRT